MMRLWCGSLEANASFDADNGIANIAVAAYGIAGTNLLNLLNGFHLIVEVLAVDSVDLAVLEGDAQLSLGLLGRDMLQIGTLGQSLRRVEQFAAADACAPDAYVVAVFQAW